MINTGQDGGQQSEDELLYEENARNIGPSVLTQQNLKPIRVAQYVDRDEDEAQHWIDDTKLIDFSELIKENSRSR